MFSRRSELPELCCTVTVDTVFSGVYTEATLSVENLVEVIMTNSGIPSQEINAMVQ